MEETYLVTIENNLYSFTKKIKLDIETHGDHFDFEEVKFNYKTMNNYRSHIVYKLVKEIKNSYNCPYFLYEFSSKDGEIYVTFAPEITDR